MGGKIISIGFAIFFAHAAVAVSFGQTTHPTSQPASGVWTPQAVVDALVWREMKLTNCSFKTSEKVFDVKPGGSPKGLVGTNDLEVKCRNRVLRVDLVAQRFDVQPNSIWHSVQWWDGAEFRWLGRPPADGPSNRPQGGVGREAPWVFDTTESFDVLGFKYAGHSVPWSVWISEILQVKGITASVVSHHDGGRDLVSMVISRPDQGKEYRFEFWSDRDFICDDCSLTYAHNLNGWYERLRVTDVKQFEGFWFPSEASTSSGNSKSGNFTKVTLESFSFSPPAEKEVEIVFPPGARVSDGTKQQDYIVLPDGGRYYRPFFDADKAKMAEPSTRPGDGI